MLQHRCLRSTGVGTAEAGETMKLYHFEAAGPNGRLQIRRPRHLTDLDRVHSPSIVVWDRLPTANRVRTRLGVLTPWVSASLAGAAGGRFLMQISMPLTQGPPGSHDLDVHRYLGAGIARCCVWNTPRTFIQTRGSY